MANSVAPQGAGAQRVLSKYCVGWWPMREGAGSVFNDRAGSNNFSPINGSENWVNTYNRWLTNQIALGPGDTEVLKVDALGISSVIRFSISQNDAIISGSASMGRVNSGAPISGLGFLLRNVGNDLAIDAYIGTGTSMWNPTLKATPVTLAASLGTRAHCALCIDRNAQTYASYVDGVEEVAPATYATFASGFDTLPGVSQNTEFVIGARGSTAAVSSGIHSISADLEVSDVQIYTTEGSLPANLPALLKSLTAREYAPLTAAEWP